MTTSLGRRDFLAAAAGCTLAAAATLSQRLAAQAYIFVQDAQRRKARHVDETARICDAIAGAGFSRVELMSDFFDGAEITARTTRELQRTKLTAPIVYVGGAFHDAEGAAKTRARALAVAEAASDCGTIAINTNPNPKTKRERKTDAELALQAAELNRLGEALKKRGQMVFYHTHDPEMAENAREWRYVLRNTDPALVHFCMDTHWIHRGRQDPIALLKEAGQRTASLHLRNSRDGVWSDTLGDGDVDHAAIASAIKPIRNPPYLVVELAYEKGTVADWNIEAALKRSREYVERVFRA
jgi:inosose dehydratase